MQPMVLWQVEDKVGCIILPPGLWTWPQQQSHQDQPWKQEEQAMAVLYSNMEPNPME